MDLKGYRSSGFCLLAVVLCILFLEGSCPIAYSEIIIFAFVADENEACTLLPREKSWVRRRPQVVSIQLYICKSTLRTNLMMNLMMSLASITRRKLQWSRATMVCPFHICCETHLPDACSFLILSANAICAPGSKNSS